MELKVRPIFRVLGIMLALLFIVVAYQMFTDSEDVSKAQYIYVIAALLFFVPLLLVSCVLGRVPYFLTRHISEAFREDLQHSEFMFTEFSARSVSNIIVFLVIVFLTTFFL